MIQQVLLRLIENISRNIWIYILPLILMGVFSLAYLLIKPPDYTSGGTLFVQQEALITSLSAVRDGGWSYLTPSEDTINEFNELLNSAAFMRAIVQQTNLESKMTGTQKEIGKVLGVAKKAVWVQDLGSNLVMVAAKHPDPEIAHQLADATVDTFLQWKINVAQSEAADAQVLFTDLLAGHRNNLEPVRQDLINYYEAHPEPIRGERPDAEQAEIIRLQNAVTAVQTRVEETERKEENARLALTQAESEVRQTYLVVDSAVVAENPTRGKRDMALTFITFVIAGAFISLLGAIGATLMDRTIQFPVDVRQAFNLPVIGMVPELAPNRIPMAEPTPVIPLRGDRNGAPPRALQRHSALLASDPSMLGRFPGSQNGR